MRKIVLLPTLLLIGTLACGIPNAIPPNNSIPNNAITHTPQNIPENPPAVPMPTKKSFIMKGVGIDIPPADFTKIKSAGIEILTTEWGMEEDITKVKDFLDKAHAAGLKVVIDGGFSYTAWGFVDDDCDNLPRGKRPVWQKERVQSWVKALKDHPAVFAWDICNEYGENLPSGAAAKNSEWPRTANTLEQLRQARNDVLQIDPRKPIIIRTYEWELDEPPFGVHRPFEAGIAEIVMLNLYSNYLENNKLQWPDIIEDVGAKCVKVIKATDSNARIWVSVSAFEQPPIFKKPTASNLTRDIEETLKIPDVDAIAFFAWGPSQEDKRWYLPQTGLELWEVIKRNIR